MIVFLFVFVAPARADSISVQYSRWAYDGWGPTYYNGSYWYTMYGYLQDQDPNTSGVQIQLVTTKSVNMLELWYENPRLGGAQGIGAQWYLFTSTQASPSPQFLTLADGCHVYVNSATLDQAEAAAIGATGRWKFWYTDGTTGWADTLTTTIRPQYGASLDDPIDAGSGSVFQSIPDLVVPGKGLPLVFAHSYTSLRNQQNGALGYGWYHSYSSKLVFLSSNVVSVDYPDGGYVQFTATSGGNYTAPVSVFETLTKLVDNTYTLTYKDGTKYCYSSAGVLTSIEDRYGNATTLSYTSGLLTSVSDPSGRSLSLTYQNNRVTQVEAKAGGVAYQTVGFTYDGNGDLVTSVDPNGHTTSYAYDSAHRLVSLRQPEAVADPNKDPLFTNTYTDGRVTSQTDALGNSSSISYDPSEKETTHTDAAQHETEYAWNNSYNITGFTDALDAGSVTVYAANGLPQSVTDPNSHTARAGYDGQGNVNALYGPAALAFRALFDSHNNPVWTQDALGERLSRTSTGLLSRDDFGSISLSDYTTADEIGTPVWSIGSGLLSQTVRYNFPAGSLARNSIAGATCATAYLSPYFASEAVADVLVATQSREGTGKAFPCYGARLTTSAVSIQKRASGAWTSLTSLSYATSYGSYRQVRIYLQDGTVYLKAGATDLSAVSLSASDAAYSSGSGGVRAYSQCKFDYLELRTGATVSLTGIPSGYLVRATKGSQTADVVSSGGTVAVDTSTLIFPLDSVAVYDSSGIKVAELTSLDLPDMGGGDVYAYDDDAGHRTAYAWDANGVFLDSITSPIGTTSFEWNTDGSLDSLTDARNHTWNYDYNASGDLTSVEDPLSHETTYEYDELGHVTASEDANGSRVETVYDDKGNPVTIRDPLAEGDSQNRHQVDISYDLDDNVTDIEDARGNTTSFSYDDMNHLTLVEGALSGDVAFTYDEVYNRASREDQNGHTTSFGYDGLNRLHTFTDPLSKVTTYGYDAVGNLTSIEFPSGDEITLTYTSDALIHEISHSADPTTFTYSYNPLRAVSQVEDSNGDSWTYTYDDGNRLESESDENNAELGTFTLERDYDAVSNVTGLDLDGLVSLALTYDARGLLASLSDPGGTTTFTRDDGGRLTEIATPDGSTRSFTYDAASRPTGVENATDAGAQAFTYTYDANGNVLSEGSTTYTYDALNRLTSWYDPVTDVTTSYIYDAGGNLTQVEENSVPTESYTYNAGDQITNTGYTYDDNGNLTADGTYTYSYDGENQLVEVKEGENTIATMTYDFIGRRTSLTTSGGTTYFHYAGSFLVAESDESGDVAATYTYTPGGGLISMTRGASTYYYQTNAHGDVVSLTDSTGVVVNSYSYDPWGKPLSATGTVVNPMRYAGCYYDDATGLYYLWHRYYDPDAKRFLTVDPAALVTFSRYAYANSNPLFSSDPMGLSALDWFNEHLNPVYGLMLAGGDMAAGYRANGARGVLDAFNMDLNPAYKMYVAYANELDAYNRGCSLWKVAGYGAEGVFHAAMLGLTGAGIEAAGERALSNLSGVDLAAEAGYVGSGGGGAVIQTGGNTIRNGTARILNRIHGEHDWKAALEALKKDWLLPNDYHGKITEAGDYLDKSGKLIGNLLDYIQ